MAKRLKINTETVREAAISLRQVTHDLNTTQASAEEVRPAVGHTDLGTRIVDYARSWNIRRGEMVQGMEELVEYLFRTCDAFDGVETELERAIRAQEEGPNCPDKTPKPTPAPPGGRTPGTPPTPSPGTPWRPPSAGPIPEFRTYQGPTTGNDAGDIPPESVDGSAPFTGTPESPLTGGTQIPQPSAPNPDTDSGVDLPRGADGPPLPPGAPGGVGPILTPGHPDGEPHHQVRPPGGAQGDFPEDATSAPAPGVIPGTPSGIEVDTPPITGPTTGETAGEAEPVTPHSSTTPPQTQQDEHGADAGIPLPPAAPGAAAAVSPTAPSGRVSMQQAFDDWFSDDSSPGDLTTQARPSEPVS